MPWSVGPWACRDAQLSLRINRSADWQDRRCNRRNEEADAEILSAILNIISDMPSYGYRRVWGILRKATSHRRDSHL